MDDQEKPLVEAMRRLLCTAYVRAASIAHGRPLDRTESALLLEAAETSLESDLLFAMEIARRYCYLNKNTENEQ